VRRRLGNLATNEAAVDVTPVMNLFVVLIPFLVSTAVFSHLGSHRFRLPGNEPAGKAQTAEQLPLLVALRAGALELSRGDAVYLALGGEIGAEQRRSRLGAELGALRAAPGGELLRVVVAVDDAVIAQEVVACLDVCRQAGFREVGLAAGTGPAKEES
jgi:biopolymer transport protein ExbD